MFLNRCVGRGCADRGPVLGVVHGRVSHGLVPGGHVVRGCVVHDRLGAVRGPAAGVVHGCAARGHVRCVDAVRAVGVRYAFHLT